MYTDCSDENLYCLVCSKICAFGRRHDNCWLDKKAKLEIKMAIKRQEMIDLEYELFLLDDVKKWN